MVGPGEFNGRRGGQPDGGVMHLTTREKDKLLIAMAAVVSPPAARTGRET